MSHQANYFVFICRCVSLDFKVEHLCLYTGFRRQNLAFVLNRHPIKKGPPAASPVGLLLETSFCPDSSREP